MAFPKLWGFLGESALSLWQHSLQYLGRSHSRRRCCLESLRCVFDLLRNGCRNPLLLTVGGGSGGFWGAGKGCHCSFSLQFLATSTAYKLIHSLPFQHCR